MPATGVRAQVCPWCQQQKSQCVRIAYGCLYWCVIASKHQAGTASEQDKRLGRQASMGPFIWAGYWRDWREGLRVGSWRGQASKPSTGETMGSGFGLAVRSYGWTSYWANMCACICVSVCEVTGRWEIQGQLRGRLSF